MQIISAAIKDLRKLAKKAVKEHGTIHSFARENDIPYSNLRAFLLGRNVALPTLQAIERALDSQEKKSA